MTNTISAIIDLKVRLEAESRKTKSKSIVGFLGVLQAIGFAIVMVASPAAAPAMAILVSYTLTMYFVIEIKKEALAPIVDALLEIEERLDSTHD
jgi:hypothetical protein